MSDETPRDETPRSFAELNDSIGGSRTACRRCGGNGTHRFSVEARDQSGQQKSGNGPVAARRSWRLCEPCAVAVFAQVAKVLR